MLDIIGNLKIDESKPERIDYFIACLKSWEFFKEHCEIYINLHEASAELTTLVKDTFKECGYKGSVFNITHSAYGKLYVKLLEFGKNPFVLNFIEDHFTLIDSETEMMGVLSAMQENKVDILKSSFLRIEHKSQSTLNNVSKSVYGKIFPMDQANHIEYGRHYGGRYLIGVNFITSREFALKFWNRDCGPRPHEYEIASYSEEWKHICMIPAMEIQCAVDDDHGEPGTSLLNRNEEKWERLYQKEIMPKITASPDQTSIESIESINFLKPVKNTPLYNSDEHFSFNDLQAENNMFAENIYERWNKIYASGNYLLADQCNELEKRFAQLIGKKYCIAVKNGTDAIILVLKYVLLERPDATVILPNFGAYPTAISVKNCTNNICFIDMDESMTMDVKQLPDIKNGIIIPVHLFGNNCNMKIIKRYAAQNNHIIIEDCAQSTGSGSGQAGDFSVFSFYPTKPLGTMGDGGAICTDSKEAYHALLALRNYGIKDNKIEHAGINSRMGELECAVVNSKIDHFEHLIEKRRVIANRYKKIVDGVRINSNHIYHQFTMLFNEREMIMEELKKGNIPFMIHYPMHISDMPVFSDLQHQVGFQVSDKIISLPCHAFMKEDHIQRVEEFLKKHKQYEY